MPKARAVKKFVKRRVAGSKDADKAVRKAIGKKAADITEPADTSALGTQKGTETKSSLSDIARTGGKRATGNRVYNKGEKRLQKIDERMADIAKLKGKARYAKEDEMIKLREEKKLLQNRQKDMKKRYAIKKPLKRKTGGTVKRKTGGTVGTGKAIRGLGKNYKKKD